MFSCSIVAICFRSLPPITLEESRVFDKLRKNEKTVRSMHNARYPTAAEAVNINQLKGSKSVYFFFNGFFFRTIISRENKNLSYSFFIKI